MTNVSVVGAGLAGSEAAWQLAQRGFHVTLYEMKPKKRTPAHHFDDEFAELVCSNSFRGDRLENAVGLLKEELRQSDSLIMRCADATRVEAGGALAVDRHAFARQVTDAIRNHPNITVVEEEVIRIPEKPVIIATGPLTSDALSESIAEYFGGADYLNFYDAAAPLVEADSVDMSLAWFASRYDRGSADYVNCAMNQEEYLAFVRELAQAEEAEVHGFEDSRVFEGCMPVEVMARRGVDTLRYGPLKPVGLKDPKTGREPYAVVQLRRDNAEGTVYNLVGFQTHLKHPEQKRVFSMIPALHDAVFLRYGVMHRNTFLNSPMLLDRAYSDRREPLVAFAGQMTGVEGYVESTASGYVASVSMAARLQGREAPDFTKKTAMGALAYYISDPSVRDFQPMNVNFGIIEPLDHRVRGKANKNLEISRRALEVLSEMRNGGDSIENHT
ncbi:MAG: methylenetetrahydrofolate--tRNA-(uracil(54)-C(5))-methyltransferase (FADH(2)-oxidizing) TrmFO [Oscillospiraceae bacterium]|nr:methylenetetrahydrofolate--tRNA-(uracil(54)-C(5))-methyltransferase (FADH(2)-oxidizing) TrmFO [Oscillospiraceae bacterium]